MDRDSLQALLAGWNLACIDNVVIEPVRYVDEPSGSYAEPIRGEDTARPDAYGVYLRVRSTDTVDAPTELHWLCDYADAQQAQERAECIRAALPRHCEPAAHAYGKPQ